MSRPVLAATNDHSKVRKETFGKDFCYRLNVIPSRCPGCRQREGDIPLLVAHSNRTSASGKPFQVTRQAMEALWQYDWPGNVRELENAIERACVLSEADTIRLADLPPLLQHCAPKSTPDSAAESANGTPRQSPLAETLYPLDIHTDSPIRVDPGDAASPLRQPLRPLKSFLREQELALINRALAQTGGDKEKAAALLEICVATLYRKLAEEG
jgi:two-component system response regulator HydG